MQKPLHLQAIANVDKTKASRKNDLSEEYSLSHQPAESNEFVASDRTDREDLEFVQSLYKQILLESRFATHEKLNHIPQFSRNEVVEGMTLGNGGFGTINAVRGFSLSSKENMCDLNTPSAGFDFEESLKDAQMRSKAFIAQHCYRDNGEARYALKRLNRKTLDDDLHCLRGMTDLANETLFLGSIDHPHIIKLRGIAADAICSKDFFIILDRLYDTLASRLVKWKAEEKKLTGLKRIFRRRGDTQRKERLVDRLNHAVQLSSALTYLHSHKIIHRDLKPENIGFDVRGDVKIFDFGLARELPRKQKGSPDDTFSMTMNAGTPRYMAPEVASGMYNESCDIYSAALVLWEFITLKRPFKDLKSLVDFEENVWSPTGTQCRPKQPTKVSPGLRRLLARSWDHEYNERPSAMQFENSLRSEISKLEDDSSEGELDSEMYSSFSTATLKRSSLLHSSTKVGAYSQRLPKLSKSHTRGEVALFDPFAASARSFLTNSDQSDVGLSFRSAC